MSRQLLTFSIKNDVMYAYRTIWRDCMVLPPMENEGK
jgi:hypothetical protein